MSAFLRASLLFCISVAVGACGVGPEIELPGATPTIRPTTLEVLNRATLDMSVYVLPETGSQRTRLGTATALTTTRFTIPERLLAGMSSLRFQADPVGSSQSHFSDQITVVPGDTVMLQIPPD